MGYKVPAGEAFASPAARALGRSVPVESVRTVAGVEVTTSERNLAERAQTLEFGCLIHPTLPREEFPGIPGKLRPTWP